MKRSILLLTSFFALSLVFASPAEAASVCNSFTDNFTDAVIDARWASYGTVTSGQQLSTIVPGSGTNPAVSEVVTKDEYEGDMQISVRLDSVTANPAPSANYGVISSVGFYIDANNYASSYYEITGGKKYIGLLVRYGGQFEDNRYEVPGATYPLHLMLRRTGALITAFYATNAGAQQIDSFSASQMTAPANLAIHTEVWGFAPNGFTGTSRYDNFSAYCYSPVYRFWSDAKQTHFYTIDASERDFVLANYKNEWNRYEGKVYSALQYANNTCPANHKPVFRFWSDKLQRHFYTIDESERDVVRDTLSATWNVYEGPRYCAASTPNNTASIEDLGKSPLFRFWSDSKQAHFYTIDAGERDFILNTYKKEWNRYEGERFYAYPW